MDVGFIGLGSMGLPMAANLVKAGHRVIVWARSKDACAAAAAFGATVSASAKETFAGDAFISILSDDDSVRRVVMESGMLPSGGANTVHINMATVSAAFAHEIAAHHAKLGISYISAPVFGRSEVAAAGKLNIIAAGDQKAITKVQPLFDAMGQRTWNLGDDPGRANVVKIGGNFMLACSLEAISEAVALNEAHGVKPADFIEIMTNTIFTAPSYKAYGDIIAQQRFEPASFKLTLGLKDVRLALAAGDSKNVALPFGSILRDNFLDALAHGDADKEWAAISNVARRRAKLT
jgi:3-hydroxyisobutyrate dehydrogenase-like beta-hydroxyacid dehydrogenase